MKQLPDDFIRQMRSLLGDDADAFLQAASQDDASVSVRLNRRKAAPLFFEETTPVTWCPQGYYLSERPSFTLDPLFHAGAYYVQEASSMFLWTAVQQALRVMEAENRPSCWMCCPKAVFWWPTKLFILAQISWPKI